LYREIGRRSPSKAFGKVVVGNFIEGSAADSGQLLANAACEFASRNRSGSNQPAAREQAQCLTVARGYIRFDRVTPTAPQRDADHQEQRAPDHDGNRLWIGHEIRPV
jgi:hypothetical protein